MLMPPQSNWQDNRFRHSSRPHSRSCKVLHLTCATGLFDIPADEDSLIRHYSLSPADRLEIKLRRRNQLGFAVQLCLVGYPGRALLPNIYRRRSQAIAFYPRREETRRDHIAHLLRYLKVEAQPTWTARCAAGSHRDSFNDRPGSTIAKTISATYRVRRALLPMATVIECMGRRGPRHCPASW
ncbi:DUF4158 domain-containing protein [Sinorhizobium fredii]|uniref:DUF4158 domain-containing protein n=1 Tax=Rhizobium fredii TaxID=380 RepID=UPI001F407786|nr:DUF4158 domain-containing protein [Sinorhizobium fredii]